MRRVAKRQVILLFEPLEPLKFWLLEYFLECLALPLETGAPGVDDVRVHLNVHTVASRLAAQTGSPWPIGGVSKPIWSQRSRRVYPVWPCYCQKTQIEERGGCGRPGVGGLGCLLRISERAA